MAHYYTNEDTLKSDIHHFKFQYRDHLLNFKSDSGVFSKKFIDYGSQVLLDAIVINEKQRRLLDVGCGYGAMGLSLAKSYPHLEVDLVDVNLKALSLCEENALVNHIDKVRIYESDVYDNVKEKFDVIISNPPIRAGKSVVFRILEESYQHLNPGGELWIVIQKKQGAPSVKNKMTEVFGNCEIVKRDKGYYILLSRKQ